MKSVAMFIAIIPLVCFITCILLYGLNRKSYHCLLSKLQKENIIPPFYFYHSNMGFMGAPVMAYLFSGLKRKRKLIFINKNSTLYKFSDENKNLINKIMPFYYTFLTGTGFTVLICFMGLIINLTHPNTATPAAQ
ncbi:hypothetical protein ABW286_10725 [Erwinia papayae]|uniref:Uncharacterized protein n=1 Tax=Erwinia papayae TaxID=206499 RepID=A0ABV3N1H0_9GAMM